MGAPKRFAGLYGTDVSAQLEAMGLLSEHVYVVGSGPEGGCEVSRLTPQEREVVTAFMRQLGNLTADREFRRACRAVLDCRTDAWRDFPLEDLLTMLALVSVMPQGLSAKTRRRLWAVDTRKTWKALKEFPNRLKNMAEEIETINGSHFFRPRNWITPSTIRGRVVGTQFSLLPGALRVYAHFVESITAKLPVMAANHALFAPVPRGYSELILVVSNLVKAVTGRFHDAEVSDLLNATDLAVKPQLRKPRFYPQTLLDLRSRQKHKFRRT